MHPLFGTLNKTGVLKKIKSLAKPLKITLKHNHWQQTTALPAYIIIALFCLLLTAAIMVGHSLFPAAQQTALLDQVKHLQQTQDKLNGKLAETEALLSLSREQVHGLKQEMELLGSTNSSMKKRLDMFEDVLAARKTGSIHFLRPSATWQDSHTIAYQLILVKGENYPRWIKGQLAFTVASADGATISLNIRNAKNSKVEMKTHAFMKGELLWPEQWQPETLTITLIDHLGRKKGHTAIPIFKQPIPSPAESIIPEVSP
ncbi:MAG: hypothetical protein ACE5DZ_04905 [Mariprofundus sp.]